MPPIVPRKRVREASPEPTASRKRGKAANALPRKPTLFDDLDATSSNQTSSQKKHTVPDSDNDDDDSSLSSLSDADFERVSDSVAQNGAKPAADDDDDDDDDEDIEFEDVEPASAVCAGVSASAPSGDLELTLVRDTRLSLANAYGSKKGASKLERKIRTATHCMHVQCLMWHNAVRNAWLCDPEIQGTLLSHLPPRLWDEVERWRRQSGLDAVEEEEEGKKKHTGSKNVSAEKGRTATTGRPKRAAQNKANEPGKESRDWSQAAERLERGVVDMSHGDPLFRLAKALVSWWKQRFRVVAPGLRKVGYLTLERMDRLSKAFKQGGDDPGRFGERIRNLAEFRACARECAGSRDVGAQLFTALLRALGLGTRMVASLQPLGFGWNKLEDAEPEKEEISTAAVVLENGDSSTTLALKADKQLVSKSSSQRARGTKRPSRKASQRTKRNENEELDHDFDLVPDYDDDDEDADESLLEEHVPGVGRRKVYDSQLEFPHYWAEVLSPVTHKFLPVDPMVKSLVATNRELVESLEPRGAKADKAKQVIAYVVGHEQDGTAKDVTIRYLKKQFFPGRTKGARLPVEKVPVYDRNGKVKRHEQQDWFKQVMLGYSRGSSKLCPITEIDELENMSDLKPAEPEKKEVKEGEETLQYYKQSKEFVLERHLKREEALMPKAKPVKMFKNTSKGKGGNGGKEEPVYSRKDVLQVKSAETWHKQGRAPINGERPLKHVPFRAATTNRRRELAEAEQATGRKALQGLYSRDQTEWIIPPPIRDGVIPKNEYGNIDLFAEHMCPEGAVHVPYRGAARVCKRLGVDYAEAVVDFEFGHRMAVPVISGVVVAEEFHERVMEGLARDEEERKRKEDEKRRKAALGMWRKLLMGMRIVVRIRREYGGKQEEEEEEEVEAEEMDVFRKSRGGGREVGKGDLPMPDASGIALGEGDDGEDMEGGFLLDGYDAGGDAGGAQQMSGFFPVGDGGDDNDGEVALEVDHSEGDTMGGFMPAGVATKEDHRPNKPSPPAPGPRRPKAKSPPVRRRTTTTRAAAGGRKKPSERVRQPPAAKKGRWRKVLSDRSDEEDEDEDEDVYGDESDDGEDDE